MIFVHIARRDDPAIRVAQKVICIVGSLAAAADNAHNDLLGWPSPGRGTARDKMWENEGSATGDEKTPPTHSRANF